MFKVPLIDVLNMFTETLVGSSNSSDVFSVMFIKGIATVDLIIIINNTIKNMALIF